MEFDWDEPSQESAADALVLGLSSMALSYVLALGTKGLKKKFGLNTPDASDLDRTGWMQGEGLAKKLADLVRQGGEDSPLHLSKILDDLAIGVVPDSLANWVKDQESKYLKRTKTLGGD